jgi:hypothetical protein
MFNDLHQLRKDEIVAELLAYLADHPQAGDTFKGIAEWWMLERRIENQTRLVKEALSDLVTMGLIAGPDESTGRYRIKNIKRRKIHTGQKTVLHAGQGLSTRLAKK